MNMKPMQGYCASNGKMFPTRVAALKEEVRDFMHPLGHNNTQISASSSAIDHMVSKRKELIAILEQLDVPEVAKGEPNEQT